MKLSENKAQPAVDNKQKTLMFPVKEQHKEALREKLVSVYESLVEKGYNPINQIVGYIVSEDPTYITNYNNARSLICRIDRDELMHELLTSYLGTENEQ